MFITAFFLSIIAVELAIIIFLIIKILSDLDELKRHKPHPHPRPFL